MIYFIISFFLVSWVVPYSEITIDPEIKPYYNEYIEIVKQYCTYEQYHRYNFKIIFDNNNHILNKGEIGICQPFPNAYKISLSKKYWDNVSDLKRFSLLIHEASHCDFDVPHFVSPTHYMYYADTYIPKELMISQLKEILKYKCKQD